MKLGAIIIARNEEEMIAGCLEKLKWLDEVILVDTGSTDKTLAVAKKTLPSVKILATKDGDFSQWRNLGFKKASADWILYVDADERINRSLKKEIISNIEKKNEVAAFCFPRENYYFGQRVKYGGSWPDFVTRLFKKSKFLGWEGIIHESPKFKGKLQTLKNPIVHLAHRNLSSCLRKGIKWTKLEAELLFQASHPRVTWWRLIKVSLEEFVKRYLILQGWRDGTVGMIEALVQNCNRFMVYVQLWEKQQKPSLKKKYRMIEKEKE